MVDAYLTEEQLGQEQSDPRTVTVGNSDTFVSLAQRRKMIYLKNTSTGGQVINVIFSNTLPASDTTGFQLNAGEGITDSDSENYKCWNGKINAFSSAAGGALLVFER